MMSIEGKEIMYILLNAYCLDSNCRGGYTTANMSEMELVESFRSFDGGETMYKYKCPRCGKEEISKKKFPIIVSAVQKGFLTTNRFDLSEVDKIKYDKQKR